MEAGVWTVLPGVGKCIGRRIVPVSIAVASEHRLNCLPMSLL